MLYDLNLQVHIMYKRPTYYWLVTYLARTASGQVKRMFTEILVTEFPNARIGLEQT